MNPKDRSLNIDALIAYIDRAISDASRYGMNDSIIAIAETVKKYTVSVKNGAVDDNNFLEALSAQCSAGDQRKQHIPSNPASSPASALSLPTFMRRNDSSPSPSFSLKLKTVSGVPVRMGKCIGKGGEGTVYKIKNMPGKVAKVYHDPLKAQQNNMEKKLRFMMEIKEVAYLTETQIAAFPEEPLYDPNGAFAGYIMSQITTSVKLYDVQREGYRSQLFPDLDYRGLIAIAYNLAEVVDHLHRNSVVIGDMNQNNICIYADGTVVLIDCDSFHIRSNTGELFPCRVGIAELLPPELQNTKSLVNGPISEKSDDFSLAIHIFRLLLNNAYPFSFVTTRNGINHSKSISASTTGILDGECAYFHDLPNTKIPEWAPPLSALPPDIQTLFRRAFSYTAETALTSINTRPSAAEWMDALQNFYQAPLIQCKKDNFHWYLPHLTDCPFCSRPLNQQIPR